MHEPLMAAEVKQNESSDIYIEAGLLEASSRVYISMTCSTDALKVLVYAAPRPQRSMGQQTPISSYASGTLSKHVLKQQKIKRIRKV